MSRYKEIPFMFFRKMNSINIPLMKILIVGKYLSFEKFYEAYPFFISHKVELKNL